MLAVGIYCFVIKKYKIVYTELINSYIKLGYPIEEAIEKANLFIQNNPDWNFTND